MSSKNSKCSYCGSNDVPVLYPLELIDYFEPVVSLYRIVESVSTSNIIDLLNTDWKVFSSDVSVNSIDLLCDIMDSGVFKLNGFEPSSTDTMLPVENWDTFREEIIKNNRYLLQEELNLDRLKSVFEYLSTTINSGTKLYRARIQKLEHKYPIDKMGMPPRDKAKYGRANPVGIPYLYTATNVHCAISEIRPHPSDYVSVIEFTLKDDIIVLDLLDPRDKVSPFDIVEESNLATLRNDLEFLCYLSEELSKPIQPNRAELEYIPTQYLCEFVKSCDYQGVLYKSSISRGNNIALFCDTLVHSQNVDRHYVKKLDYEHIRMNILE